MRNDVFSRSPFGRKAYAHGLHFDPARDRSPLEPPLPPDSPILARWSAVRNCLPPLAELLDVEIVLMSAEGYCVGGTGTHRGGGCKMPEDTALTYSLRSGQSTMVLSPGEDAVCRACARIWRISPARCPRAGTSRSWSRLWRSRTTGAWDSLGCSPESGVTRMGEPIRGWRETPGRPEWR